MTPDKNTRLSDLERRFAELEGSIRPGPEKEALSILHALIHESRRAQPPAAGSSPAENRAGKAAAGVADLYKSAPPMEGVAENEGLPEGAEAPGFTLRDAGDRPVSLHDFRGQTVVLVFYPLDWSPACSDQLSLYQEELAEFEKYGARLLGISVDSIYSHGAWAAVRGLTIPLLADFHPRGDVARRYHVYRESDGFSERALFVVDRDGIIRYAHVSPELHKVPDIYELFERLEQMRKPQTVS